MGCYLCRILYNAEWTPRSECRREKLPLVEHIKDLTSPPQMFTCRVNREAAEEARGGYFLEALGFIYGSETQIWQLKLLLVQENGIL